MSFLLDTDICSAHLKANRQVWGKFLQHTGQLHISAVSLGELSVWVCRKNASPGRRRVLDSFLLDVAVLDVTSSVAEKFGAIRAAALDAGQHYPDMDLLIAATALVHDLTLVTHNVKDFKNIPGLHIQDWLAS